MGTAEGLKSAFSGSVTVTIAGSAVNPDGGAAEGSILMVGRLRGHGLRLDGDGLKKSYFLAFCPSFCPLLLPKLLIYRYCFGFGVYSNRDFPQ